MSENGLNKPPFDKENQDLIQDERKVSSHLKSPLLSSEESPDLIKNPGKESENPALIKDAEKESENSELIKDAEEELEKLHEAWLNLAKKGGTDLIPLIKESIHELKLDKSHKDKEEGESGTVLSVGDGIATVSGLPRAFYGEILIFADGTRGMVLDLREEDLACVLFGDDRNIVSGSPVRRTKRVAGIPVGEKFLGRVVDALGTPIDGKGEIESAGYLPIENDAPSIIDRQAVDTPLDTGLLTIDSMFPIGRGQRELIIGDRQTGKTAIALDAILNQRGKGVYCIYVAIGQKMSSVAKLVQKLCKYDALSYVTVVIASAGDAAPLQYIAPFSGCALAEYFMNQGRDTLIVYDDLSKHAQAYRTLSLLLGRPPGREAYPGDIFYLHSRLLERSAHLSRERGGGSMTALPIVETQAGDISAYIPTNVISITDGQIFLESSLFFSGQRPAVNIGLSVSRVGGDAQTDAMKKAAGTIRLDLAQYREMEVFNQFSADLDESTKSRLKYGTALMEVLKQDEYHPLTLSDQVVLLIASRSHLFDDLTREKIGQYKAELLSYLGEKRPDLLNNIEKSRKLGDEEADEITGLSEEFKKEILCPAQMR